VIAVSLGSPAPAKAEPGAIYVNAPQGYSTADLGSALQRALGDKRNFAVEDLRAAPEVMRRIATDPRSIGLVQRDFYVRYLRDHAEGDARFEFYGNIPVCLMAVVRKGSPVQTYGDLVKAQTVRPTTLDVGPADEQLAATFDALRQMDRSLVNLRLEHRGGARALGRVISGETDAALFLVRAPYADGLVMNMINGGALDLVPFFSEDIVIGARRGELHYLLRQITLGKQGWFASGRPYHTTCTSLGAVVNAAADARLSEKVAQIVLGDAPAEAGGPWYEAVGNLVVLALGEVKRLVVGAGEVITAWFAPAEPGAAIAQMPATTPEFHAVRDGGNDRRNPAAPARSSPAAAR